MPATVILAVLLLLSQCCRSGLDPNPHNGGLGILARKTWCQGGSIRRPSSAYDRGHRPRSAAAGMRQTTMFQVHYSDCINGKKVQKLACRSCCRLYLLGHRNSGDGKVCVIHIQFLAERKGGDGKKVRRLGPGKTVQI